MTRITRLNARLTLSSLPRPAAQRALGKVGHDRLPDRHGGGRERHLPAARRNLLVEPAGHEPPCVAIIGHVGVLVPVELSTPVLLVDVMDHGDPRVRVLRGEHVAQSAERRRLPRGEEADRRHVLDPVEDHLACDRSQCSACSSTS